MPLVLIVQTAAGIARHALRRPRLIVGRGDDCDIVVADGTVSRRHLVLEVDAGTLRFHDLGGTNVPLLDGEPTTAGELRPGSWLVLGLTRLGVETDLAGDGTRRIDTTPRSDRRTHVPTRQGRSRIDASAALRALQWAPLRGPDFVTEIAARLLAAARAICRHDAGMICARAAGSTTTVLAAQPAEPDAFPVPAEVIGDVTEAQLISAEGLGDRVIVPLTADTVLVLGEPGAGAPSGAELLDLAVEFGRTAAVALEDARGRAAERSELDALRYARSLPGRAVCASSRLSEARSSAIEAASQGVDLRISGEEGCEAEDVARYYHMHSPLHAGPFVPCYARLLSRGRMAQELASSDSVQEGGGSCAVRAAGGTLFVDSPETLGPNMQLQLAELINANRRGTAAARFQLVVSLIHDHGHTPSLQPALAAALDTCAPCTIPPLRVHPPDALALASVILEDLGPNAAGVPRRLTEAAERVLLAYRWPGNAAQHRRVIEIAAARAGTGPIDVAHFPEELHETSLGERPFQTLEEVENEYILRVLRLSGGNRRKAARRLGIAYSTMFARLARLGH